jgi:hypothetical protein
MISVITVSIRSYYLRTLESLSGERHRPLEEIIAIMEHDRVGFDEMEV